MPTTKLTAADIAGFLAERHPGRAIADIETLAGGFWSSAFGYRAADDELVVRFGPLRDGFEADRAAMAYATPQLPVPAVLEIGDAFGGAYAISERRYGRFLESVRPEEADDAGPTIVRLLGALHDAPPPPAPGEAGSWRSWLLGGLVDDPRRTVHGWRAAIAAEPVIDRLYRACEARVRELVDACPERRDLIHGDLLHGNVLVAENASRTRAIFSWKCSARGDFLFDTAWCTLWGDFAHPGIAAADVARRVFDAPWAKDDLADAAVRHHCYEMHIATTHLGWYTWTADETARQALVAHAARLLEQGPKVARP